MVQTRKKGISFVVMLLCTLLVAGMVLVAFPLQAHAAATVTGATGVINADGTFTLTVNFSEDMNTNVTHSGLAVNFHINNNNTVPSTHIQGFVYPVSGAPRTTDFSMYASWATPRQMVLTTPAAGVDINGADYTYTAGEVYEVSVDFFEDAAGNPVPSYTKLFAFPILTSATTGVTDKVAAAGQDVKVTLAGAGLPFDTMVSGFVGTNAVATSVSVDPGSTKTSQTATLTIPENTGDAERTFSIMVSYDGGQTWQATGAQLVQKAADTEPVITSFTVDTTGLTYQGGWCDYTLEGKNLPKTINMYLVSGQILDETTAREYVENRKNIAFPSYVDVTDNGTRASGKLWMPINESTQNDLITTIVFTTMTAGHPGSGASMFPNMYDFVTPKAKYYAGDDPSTGIPSTGGQTSGFATSANLGNFYDIEKALGIKLISLTGQTDTFPDVIISVDGDYQQFQSGGSKVTWNGASIYLNEQFTATAGSTVIRLRAGFLRTQPSGDYRVRVWFPDGYSDTIVSLYHTTEPTPDPGNGGQQTTSPQTGDAGIALSLVALLCSAGGSAALLAGRRRRR